MSEEKIKAATDNYLEEMKKAKKKFDPFNDRIEILKQLKVKEESLGYFQYNPNKQSVDVLYNIKDSLQQFQIDFAKMFNKALRFGLAADLLYEQSFAIYEKCFDKIMSNIPDGLFSNVGQKNSYAKNKMEEAGIVQYKEFAKEEQMKGKNVIRRIETLIKAIEKVDEKTSRKITVMGFQDKQGVLNLGNKEPI